MFLKKLLLLLSLSVCGVMASVSQCVLEAQVPSEMSLKPLQISCDQHHPDTNENRELYLHDGNRENPRFQSEHFRGRVQVHQAQGLVRVTISKLRPQDSGSYDCTFFNSGGRYTKQWQVSVSGKDSETDLSCSVDTALSSTTQTSQDTAIPAVGATQRPTEPTGGAVAGGRQRSGLWATLGLLLGLGLLLTLALKVKSVFSARHKPPTNQIQEV